MFIFSIKVFSTAKATQNDLLTFAGLVVVVKFLVISFKITQGTLILHDFCMFKHLNFFATNSQTSQFTSEEGFRKVVSRFVISTSLTVSYSSIT